MTNFLFVIITTLLVGCAQTQPVKGTSPAQETVNALSRALSGQQIERMEIIQMNPWLLTRSRITPQMLEKQYDYKLIIGKLSGFGSREKMIKALGSVSVQPRDDWADLRWGVIFYTQNDVRVGALYFNHFSSHGSVNDTPVSIEGDFFSWLDQTYTGCFK